MISVLRLVTILSPSAMYKAKRLKNKAAGIFSATPQQANRYLVFTRVTFSVNSNFPSRSAIIRMVYGPKLGTAANTPINISTALTAFALILSLSLMKGYR